MAKTSAQKLANAGYIVLIAIGFVVIVIEVITLATFHCGAMEGRSAVQKLFIILLNENVRIGFNIILLLLPIAALTRKLTWWKAAPLILIISLIIGLPNITLCLG